MKKKTFSMLCNLTKWWYLCCYKHSCHKSQCLSKYLLPCKNLSFERKFNNEFKNFIIAIKLPRRQIKQSWYFEAATETPIGILSFLSEFLKNNCERDHFWQCHSPSALLKKEFFLRHFSRILLIDAVVKIIKQLVWRKPFQSEHLQWLLLLLTTIS